MSPWPVAFENILLERSGAVATVTVNRPKVLNALNGQTLRELAAAFDEVEADAGIRALVVTGAGEKAFVAGADINELAQMQPLQAKDLAFSGQQVFARLSEPIAAGTPALRTYDPDGLSGQLCPPAAAGQEGGK